jgi:O-antigen ligase
MVTIPLHLLLLILPFAVAGHNICVGIVAAFSFGHIFWRWRQGTLPAVDRRLLAPMAWGAAYVACVVVGTALNDASPASPGRIIWGYLPWLLLPLTLVMSQAPLAARTLRQLGWTLALVATVFGVTALTQVAWGWKLDHSRVVDTIHRAQAFYSHPLTFAYVALLIFPLGAAMVCRRPRDPIAWAVFGGSLASIYASQSRTVQAVAALVLVADAWYFSPKRWRLVALSAVLAAGVVIAVTDNPVRDKFSKTLAGHYDSRSGYLDDRLAFWHAASEMIKDRPWLGHGDDLDQNYRRPYYERIGLPDFVRPYEAHNTFLQAAVNGGALGFVCYMGWWGSLLIAAWREGRRTFAGKVVFQTLVAFMAASLTQNSVQDAEVRYALTLVVAALYFMMLFSATSGSSSHRPAQPG